MLDDSLYRRLEALNRQRLPATLQPRSAPPRPQGAVARQLARSGRGLAKGEPLLERATEVCTAHGPHASIQIPLSELWPSGENLVASRHEYLLQSASDEPPPDVAGFLGAFPGRFVALDLETCGLSGAALFLVGLLRSSGERLVVELLLARNYAEERAVLATLGERLAGAEVLVTFNGKSFDWPMVGDRWRRHLLDRHSPLPGPLHFDVLHHARRRWRKQMPDCKLQTLERLVCRRSRVGDIAGHRIPAAYERFVRTGAADEMEPILYHNAVDLVTLLDLALRVAG